MLSYYLCGVSGGAILDTISKDQSGSLAGEIVLSGAPRSGGKHLILFVL